MVTALTVALTIGGSTSRARATVPRATLTPASFTNDFSAMATLKPLAKKGKGNVAVLLPDTQSSARYVSFDAPYLTQAFQAAGLSSDQFQVQNAQGSTQTMQTQAEAAITNGATVLVIDPLDSGSGAAIEANAVQQGVKVIDYDRLTLNGKASYYVSFNNVTVGKLLGEGPGRLCRGVERDQAAGARDGRRSHRQQRHAVRPGLQLGPQPEVQEQDLRQGR